MWKNDIELFQLIDEMLYTPVVGDILDTLGKYHQFLPQPIRPSKENIKVIGRAMPVIMTDVYGPQKKPFGLLTEALDQLQENDVYIASGGDHRCAYWGELLTATARTHKAAGAIIDGFHRDTPQMLAQDFPVFSRGSFAQDSSVRTQVVNFRCPVEINGVWINPGDLVFADIDGVLIIPKELEEEVITKALEKAKGEKVVRKAIENGMSATEAFATFGIL
jgi:regulator of RNase E activity RraA